MSSISRNTAHFIRALLVITAQMFSCGLASTNAQGGSGAASVPDPKNNPRVLFERGQAALQQGHLPEAEAAFRSVLVLDPNSTGAYANLGVVYMREKRWKSALAMLHKAEHLSPGVPDVSAFPRAAWLAAARRALASAPARDLSYGDPRGLLPLRTALAGYLARARGVAVTADRIVVCAGFSQALELLAQVLVARGAGLLAVETFGHDGHWQIARGGGLSDGFLWLAGTNTGCGWPVCWDVRMNIGMPLSTRSLYLRSFARPLFLA